MLAISADTKVDFIRWNLVINPTSTGQHLFTLDIVFGEAQQNTLNFEGGGEKISFSGKYLVKVNTASNLKGEIYHLQSSRLPRGLLLLKVNDNLFHLLTAQYAPMVGDATYSYTLNRLNPAATSSAAFDPTAIPQGPENSLDTVVSFIGRSPCSAEASELIGVSPIGCNRIKWALTLHRDPLTCLPTTFRLRSVYVGTVDSAYTTLGRWQARKAESQIFYLLSINGDQKRNLTFLKGGDNVLFLLDRKGDFMVGNSDHSYTLNRKIN
jgi:hypothetical protein